MHRKTTFFVCLMTAMTVVTTANFDAATQQEEKRTGIAIPGLKRCPAVLCSVE